MCGKQRSEWLQDLHCFKVFYLNWQSFLGDLPVGGRMSSLDKWHRTLVLSPNPLSLSSTEQSSKFSAGYMTTQNKEHISQSPLKLGVAL